jgi:catechol 2,3-dioxygenase-like lactoylglutathione lyase family enzyme
MTSPFGLVLWTTDISSLAGFLAEVGGVTVVAQHPGMAELDAGGVHLTLVEDEADRGHPWWDALSQDGIARGVGVILRFEVADVLDAYATAQDLGGGAVLPPHDLEGTRECQVLGPDGYLCSLWQPRTIGMAPLTGIPAIRRDPTRSKPRLGGIIRRR